MKKTITLSILLALACLLSACTFVPQEDRIPIHHYTLPPITEETEPTTKEEKPAAEPSDPALLIGDWYSESAALVIQFSTITP